MKKVLTTLLLLVALALPRAVWAQGELTVCNGTATNNNVPFYGYYYDSPNNWTQSIYPDSLFTDVRGESIYQMTWYPYSGGDQMGAFAQPVTVKLGVLHSQSAFSGTTAVPADSLTTVWTGLLGDLYDNGLMVMPFDTPFLYPADGGNLVVEFCKPQQGTYKQVYFYGMSTTGTDASLRSYSGGNYSLQQFLAKVTLAYGTVPDCDRPASTAVVEENAYDATVSWTSVADASSYELALSTEPFSADTVSGTDFAYDTTYTFQNLSANTPYYYAVRANCSDNSFWRYGSFRTGCVPLESTNIPYFDNFDSYASGEMPPCWNSISSVTGYPRVGNSTYNSHSGSNSIYLSSSTGSYGYAILPPLSSNLNASDMQLRFFAKGDNGLSFEVGVMDNATDGSTFTLVGSASVTSTYQEFEFPLNSYEGTGSYIAIRMSGPASYYYVYIDDLNLEDIPTCIRPVEAHCVSATADEATISWTPADDNGSSYTLFYGPNADMSNLIDSLTVNDTVETITDLSPMTTYYAWVRTDCYDGSSNLRPAGSFTTQCAALPTSALPYTQGFDGYTSSGNQPVPQCWEKVLTSADGANPCPYNGNAHNGTYAVSFYKGGGGDNLLAMPQFEDLDQLAVTFWAFKGNNNGFCDLFVVGVMEGANFVGIDTIPLTSTYTEYTVSFANYDGTGNTPAFYARSNNGDLRLTLDEVTVDFAPQCLNPYAVQALGTTSTGAMLSWNGDENLTYEVAYDTVEMTNSDLESASYETAYGTTITLYGLEPSHTYHVYVRSDCGGGAYSNWAHGTFQTQRCDDGCDLTINMHDSYGDGWNGGGITVWQGDENLGSATLPVSTSNGSATFHVCPDDTVYFMFSPGSYPSEISFEILDANENDLYTSAQGALTAAGQFFAWVPTCVAPTCPRPANATVGNVTAYTANLTWVDADVLNPVGDYMVIYGTSNDPAQATDSVEFYDQFGQLTGLTPSTTYYAWVHAVCGGEVSQDRAFGSFSTSCAPFTLADLPFSENFDNLTGTGNMAWPACWNRISGDGDNPCPNYSTDHAHSGTNAVSMWTSGEHGYANLFALPEFEDLNQLQISFWAQLWFATGVEHLIVGVMEGTTFVPVDTVPLTVGYSEYSVSFADYTGTGIRPAFYGKNMSGQELRVNVDDIVVDLIPDCARPTNVVMTDRGATTIDVAWANDGANGYDLFWSDNANDAPYVMMSVTDTFATITGLDTNTIYYVYVRANCGNAVSEWTIPTQMQTFLCDDPCDVLVTFESTAEWGTAWNAIYLYMGGQELAKIMGTYTSSSPYHVAVCPSTPIILARECYHSSHASNVTSTVTTLYDQVLATMPLGTNCGTNQMIYIDTFTTTCQAPTCFNPLNVAASGIDSVSATITWSDDIASLWQLEYGPAGFAQGNGTVVANLTTQSYTITGLNPNTAYDVYVSTVCTDTMMTAPVCHFRTACGIILMLPYSEDFESYNEAQIPTCWEQIHNQGNNPCVSEAASLSHGGSRLLSFWHNQSGAQNTLATPNFGDLSGKQISFWARTNNGVPQFSVGVVDNQGNYIALDSTIALTSSYQQFTIDLTPWAQYGSHVAFHTLCTSNNTQQVYIDDVVVDLIPDCPAIVSISANTGAATTTSVQIAWNDTANVEWEYIYDILPINNDALYTPVQTSSNPLTLTGLTAATTYHIYVRPVCNGVVPWAYVSAATTVCDNGCEVELVMHDSYGDGWNGNTICVYQNSILMGSGTIANGNANTERISICPNIPINFNWVTGSYAGETSFEINDAWDNELYTCASGDNLTNGATFFTYTTNCQTPTCFRPMNVAATNVSGASATITWFDTMATSWTIQYDTADFTPGASNVQTLTAFTQSVTLTGLTNSTTYYVYVQAQCTDTSIWSDLCTFRTEMCDNAVVATTGDAITGTTISGAPGYAYYKYSLSGTIIDSAELANLAGAEIMAFAFYPTNATNGAYYNNCQVYLGHTTESEYTDANSNWIFDSSFVKVYDGSLNFSEAGWQTFLFDTVFTWNGSDNLVLVVNRNTGSYGSTGGSPFAATECTGFKTRYAYTDSDPYDVFNPAFGYNGSSVAARANYHLIACGAGCAMPGNLYASNVNYHSATITWTGNGSDYELAYRATNEATFSQPVAVSGFSHPLTGLQPASTYLVRVRQLCDEGVTSEWASFTFTTDSLPCMAPHGLTVSHVTGTSATLAWTPVSTETQWEVRYAAQGDTMSAIASSTSHQLTDLFTGATYTAWVRALCGNGSVESDWSEPVEFTTLQCPLPGNVTVGQVAQTSAVITWTAPEGYSDFTLLYGNDPAEEHMTPVMVDNATTYTLDGLTPSKLYFVSVKTRCAEDWESGLTAAIDFTTLNVGIGNVDAAAVSLYPNPATDQVTILGYEGEVQIVDMTGRTVLRTHATTIDLSALTAGAYFVRMGDTVKKLIVK